MTRETALIVRTFSPAEVELWQAFGGLQINGDVDDLAQDAMHKDRVLEVVGASSGRMDCGIEEVKGITV